MEWIELLKNKLPESAKDIRLNLESVLTRSSLDNDVAIGCAIAAAISSGNQKLASFISDNFDNDTEKNAVIVAASLMAQNNVWYPYNEMVENAFKGIPLGLRMNGIVSHGGTSKDRFEVYSLSASIVGKCHFCVRAHFAELQKQGYTIEQLKDIGKIASVINAVSKFVVD